MLVVRVVSALSFVTLPRYVKQGGISSIGLGYLREGGNCFEGEYVMVVVVCVILALLRYIGSLYVKTRVNLQVSGLLMNSWHRKTTENFVE